MRRPASRNSYVTGLNNAAARGRKDYNAGKPKVCPYTRGDMRLAWKQGWDEAKRKKKSDA